MEDSDGYKLDNGNPSKEILTDICIIACDTIAESKLSPIIYANADWFKNKLDLEKLKNYMKWIAFWQTEEKNIDKEKYQIWQYSSKGKINGIKGLVDLNFSFVDFISLKEYVQNIIKINFIKSVTLLNDLDIQFISCYKWGQHLVNKIYEGLKNGSKIQKENLNYEKQLKAVQKYFNLELKTINYLNFYIHSERMLQNLYNSITIESNIVNIVD